MNSDERWFPIRLEELGTAECLRLLAAPLRSFGVVGRHKCPAPASSALGVGARSRLLPLRVRASLRSRVCLKLPPCIARDDLG